MAFRCGGYVRTRQVEYDLKAFVWVGGKRVVRN